MTRQYKAKLAHMFDSGDKIELEAWVEAESYDAAFAQAKTRFKEVAAQLAGAEEIEIDGAKIETPAHKH